LVGPAIAESDSRTSVAGWNLVDGIFSCGKLATTGEMAAFEIKLVLPLSDVSGSARTQ
jgi:hypothetical protein